MDKIKIGIVGAGVWGETHADIFQDHPATEVVAICDADGGKARARAAQFGIGDVYTDFREMAKKCRCDAVSIVTPDFLHADIAVAMAQSGKHMLIEKPLATTREDVERMVSAIDKAGVRAMVDLHNRWSPPYNLAKQEIEGGALGVPQSAYMRLNDVKWVATDMLPWAGQSSILWFLGSHSVDTLRWLIGSEVETVYAVKREGLLKKLGVDTVDMYMTTMVFQNGAIAQMENGWISPNGNTNINDMQCTVLLEAGKIDIDTSSHNMIQISTEEKTLTPDVIVKNRVFGRCKGFAYESIRSFADHLASGTPFDVSIADAANTTLVVLAIMESAESGQVVKVRY